jgi:hypothetical protein
LLRHRVRGLDTLFAVHGDCALPWTSRPTHGKTLGTILLIILVIALLGGFGGVGGGLFYGTGYHGGGGLGVILLIVPALLYLGGSEFENGPLQTFKSLKLI